MLMTQTCLKQQQSTEHETVSYRNSVKQLVPPNLNSVSYSNRNISSSSKFICCNRNTFFYQSLLPLQHKLYTYIHTILIYISSELWHFHVKCCITKHKIDMLQEYLPQIYSVVNMLSVIHQIIVNYGTNLYILLQL
jgi:hypothetical protein